MTLRPYRASMIPSEESHLADSGETRQAIAIGPRIVASSGFDALYREGMGLIEAVAAYLDAEGRVESRMLPREVGVAAQDHSLGAVVVAPNCGGDLRSICGVHDERPD